MSKERLEIIDCPNCGEKSEFIVWDSLNGDLDPHAKQMLLNGSLFRFKCANCGHVAGVGYDILYHDMSNRAMVYLVRPEMVEETKKMMDYAATQMGVVNENYTKRIVTDQNHLREKAIIFDGGLDDRLIEIIKVFMFTEAYKKNNKVDLDHTYFYLDGDTMSMQFICDTPLTADIPQAMYDEMKEHFGPKLAELNNDEQVIDSFWAMRTLTNWQK